MNKNSAILISVSFTLLSIGTRDQIPSSNQVKIFICNTWRLTQLENPEKRIDLPQEISMVMTFKKDSSFVSIEQGKEYPGKWSYDPKTMTLTTTEKGGIGKHKILSISNLELKIEENFAGKIVTGIYKKVDKTN